MMMEDDRLLHHLPAIRADLDAERRYLEELRLPVWDLAAGLAKRPEYRGQLLQDDVLHSMHTAFAYLHENCLAKTEVLPLSLVCGDIDNNVRAFAEAPQPDYDPRNPNISKIWICAQIDRAGVVLALRTLKGAPFSIQLCEKAHAHGSVINRYHSRLGARTLQLRSAITNARIFFRTTREDRESQSLSQKLAGHLQSVTSRYTGRDLFMHLLLKGGGRTTQRQGPDSKFAIANRAYNELGQDDKYILARDAAEVRQKRNDDKGRLIADALADVRLDRFRRRETFEGCGIINSMQSAHFSVAELASAAAMWRDWEPSETQGDWPEEVVMTHAPPEPLCEEIARVSRILDPGGTHALPWWASLMVNRRSLFRRTAIATENGEDGFPDTLFIFQLACQRPQYATFRPAHRIDHLRPFGADDNMWSQLPSYMFMPRYCIGDNFVSARDIEIDDTATIFLVSGLFYIGSFVVAGDSMEFEQFLMTLPAGPGPSEPREPQRSERIPRAALAALRQEYPWLTEEDLGIVSRRLHVHRDVQRPGKRKRGIKRGDTKKCFECFYMGWQE